MRGRSQGHSATGRKKSIEKSITSSGMEPATFQLAAWYLNQSRYRVIYTNINTWEAHKCKDPDFCSCRERRNVYLPQARAPTTLIKVSMAPIYIHTKRRDVLSHIIKLWGPSLTAKLPATFFMEAGDVSKNWITCVWVKWFHYFNSVDFDAKRIATPVLRDANTASVSDRPRQCLNRVCPCKQQRAWETEFWVLTPFSSQSWLFGGIYRPHLQGRRLSSVSSKQNQYASLAYFRPWRWRQHVPPKRQWTYTGP
jgi:hypothetical protein